MRFYFRNISFVFFIGLSITSKAQDYKKDVLAIYEALRSAKAYSMTVEYRVYIDKNLVKPYQSRAMEIKRQKNNLHIKQSKGIEMMFNADHKIVIDNEKKKMVVSKRVGTEHDKELNLSYDNYMKENIDTLLKVYENIRVIQNTSDIVKYECIYKPNPNVIRTVVTINKKMKMFESMLTEYKEPIEINELGTGTHKITRETKYMNFKQDVTFPKEIFNLETYVYNSANGKMLPKTKFNNYEITVSK